MNEKKEVFALNSLTIFGVNKEIAYNNWLTKANNFGLGAY